jgi:sulfur carrier protein
MRIFVNESEVALEGATDIEEVLRAVEIEPDQRGIAVAVNDHVVRRAEWNRYKVSAGDRIEVIQATQGG